jgi:hypothetical protein
LAGIDLKSTSHCCINFTQLRLTPAFGLMQVRCIAAQPVGIAGRRRGHAVGNGIPLKEMAGDVNRRKSGKTTLRPVPPRMPVKRKDPALLHLGAATKRGLGYTGSQQSDTISPG